VELLAVRILVLLQRPLVEMQLRLLVLRIASLLFSLLLPLLLFTRLADTLSSGRRNTEDEDSDFLRHDWDPITGVAETLDDECFFVFVQVPAGATSEQLACIINDAGGIIAISKSKSKSALKAGALINAFKKDAAGKGLHDDSDVRTVAVHKAIRSKFKKSPDPNACIAVQEIELPWEAERRFTEFSVESIQGDDGTWEVWMHLEVKHVGNQHQAPQSTPKVPTPSFGPVPSSHSGASASNGPSNNNNNGSTGTTPPRSKRNKPASPKTSANANASAPGPTFGVPSAAAMPARSTNASAPKPPPPTTVAGTVARGFQLPTAATATTSTFTTTAMPTDMQQMQNFFQQQMAAEMKKQQEAFKADMIRMQMNFASNMQFNGSTPMSIPSPFPSFQPPKQLMGPVTAQLKNDMDDDDDL